MKLLIFKTSLKTTKEVKAIKTLFDNRPTIRKWSVDTEDIDKVLRIEARQDLYERDIIRLLQTRGYVCEPLAD